MDEISRKKIKYFAFFHCTYALSDTSEVIFIFDLSNISNSLNSAFILV